MRRNRQHPFNKRGVSLLAFPALLVVSLILISGAVFFGISCSETTSQKETMKHHTAEEFNQYWFQGLAEISRFDLEQVRYGEIR